MPTPTPRPHQPIPSGAHRGPGSRLRLLMPTAGRVQRAVVCLVLLLIAPPVRAQGPAAWGAVAGGGSAALTALASSPNGGHLGDPRPTSAVVGASSSAALSSAFAHGVSIASLRRVVRGLVTNPIWVGGMALMLVGVIGASLRRIPGAILKFALDRIVVCVTVESSDPSFHWVEGWMARQTLGRRARKLRLYVPDHEDDESDTRDAPVLVPGDGAHLMRHQGYPIWVSIGSDKDTPLLSRERLRTMHMRTLWTGRAAIAALVREAHAASQVRTDGQVRVYAGRNGVWRMVALKQARPLDSLVFPAGVAERVLTDAQRFRARASWYATMGIPYRRSYLLHGAPGNGKTSFAIALAGALGRDLAVMGLSDAERKDPAGISDTIRRAPGNAILLLEDVDTLFMSREQGDEAARIDADPVFGVLLNSLDGVYARDGRIVIMTTNYKHRLDAALIRPGRADMHLEIGNATPETAARFYRRFYPEASAAEVTRFTTWAGAGTMSMAMLQEHCMRAATAAAAAHPPAGGAR